MKIDVELKGYCIQTGIKKTYERLVQSYFRSSKAAEDLPADLENRIETLKYLLETVDFGTLRRQYPALNGERPLTVVLVTGSEPTSTEIEWEGNRVAVFGQGRSE